MAITQIYSEKIDRFLDKEGNTPLTVASKIGNLEAAKLLINEYVNVNAQNVIYLTLGIFFLIL